MWVSAMPEQMWISTLAYKEEFPPKSGDVRSLSFEGFIKTGNPEQDLVVGTQFYDKIVESRHQALCGTQAEIKYRDVATAGADADVSQRRDANSGLQTSFTFTCGKGGTSR